MRQGDTEVLVWTNNNYKKSNALVLIEQLTDNLAGQSFVICKVAGFQSLFRINNIPLARYKISAKVNGKYLNLKQTGVFNQMFGMTPHETNSGGNLLFAPGGGKSESVAPQTGGWDAVNIDLALQ